MTEKDEKNPVAPILLVDDEYHTLNAYKIHLLRENLDNVITCMDGKEALDILNEQEVSVIILDLMMPGVNGQELLGVISKKHPEVPVIIATATTDAEMAVKCMKAGAFDFLIKPIEPKRLTSVLRHALEMLELRNENQRLSKIVLGKDKPTKGVYDGIITQDEKIFSIFRYIDSIAKTNLPVLITGESGVGKELIAQAVHKASERQGKFVTVNVAGLDDATFSDTLFGHRKGAFTSADSHRDGLVKNAVNGTLFLDEIGDLSDASQVKLLRLIQEHEFYSLGSDSPEKTNARIITATNKDLDVMQKKGDFRNDLFYRLNLHHIRIPALRERLGDLGVLCDFFIGEAAATFNIDPPAIPEGLIDLLEHHTFPGNIRELHAMLYDAISSPVFGELSIDYFRKRIDPKGDAPLRMPVSENSGKRAGDAISDFRQSLSSLPSLQEVENFFIQQAIEETEGNLTHAADILGISRITLYRKLKKLAPGNNGERSGK